MCVNTAVPFVSEYSGCQETHGEICCLQEDETTTHEAAFVRAVWRRSIMLFIYFVVKNLILFLLENVLKVEENSGDTFSVSQYENV